MLGEFKIITTITPRDDSSVNRYLAEVNKIPMISPEREVELAQRIHKGDEEAVKELVLANLRFAVSVAKKYQYTGMPFADLVAEANCGLIKAAQMFDYTKGFKFISYAVWWIRQSIHQAIANYGKLVRLPNNKHNTLNKILSFSVNFYQEKERNPSPAEVSEALNLTEEQVLAAMCYDGRSFSISTPLGDDPDGGTWEDVMKSDMDGTDHQMECESLKTDILAALSTLTPRENKIVKMVFGIGQPSHSTTDVALELNLTRERVRQLYENSMKKLKSNPQVCVVLQKYLAS